MRTSPFVISVALLLGCAPRSQPPSEAPLVESPSAPPATQEPVAPAGPRHFKGAVELPGGRSLEFFVLLDSGGKSTISIPAQGLLDGELGDVAVSASALEFSLAAVGAKWTATVADGAVTECAFSQSGVQLGCSLEAIDAEAFAAARTPARPQTPEPPFPYDAEELAYDNEADGVHLEGTLTLPPGDGPHPAALLITGSGAQDRDETLAGHKPFAVLADHLTRKGIAVLRVDDRGVGGSTGSVSESTGAALTRDAQAGIERLRSHPRIDGTRVGVIGHSEGGALGPRVAAADRKIAFVVMMAGPGVAGHEVVRLQAVEIAKTSGASEAEQEMVRQRQNATIDAIMAAGSLEAAREAATAAPGADPNASRMVTPWFVDFLKYDPAPTLKKVKCPVLVLNGELDLQVIPDQNLPPIEAALKRNKNVKVLRLPGLNHLFQTAKTGSPAEYAAIEETIAPAVLEEISSWVVGIID